MPCHGSIQSSRWLTIGIVAGAVVAVALGAWLPRDEGSRDDGGAIAGPVLIATAVALALVARGFATLRIDVDASVLRARFGPFGVMLAGEPIGEARVVPYRCLAYGGGACATAARAGA